MRSLTGAGYTGLRAAGVPWSVAAMATLYRADRAVVGGVARGPTAILEDGGAIVAIGAPAEVAADPRAAGATIVDWPRCAITPGTVNSHNHSFQSLLRGIGDDLPFLVWRERALYRYSPRLDAEGMAHRGAVRVRRDAAPRGHHGLRLLLPERRRQRPRERHDRGGARPGHADRPGPLLLRLGRRPGQLSRVDPDRDRQLRPRCTAATTIATATWSRSSRRPTASTARPRR
jgi:hypothetical protein